MSYFADFLEAEELLHAVALEEDFFAEALLEVDLQELDLQEEVLQLFNCSTAIDQNISS